MVLAQLFLEQLCLCNRYDLAGDFMSFVINTIYF